MGDVESHMDKGGHIETGSHMDTGEHMDMGGTGEWDTGTRSGTQGHVSLSPWQDDFSGPPSPQGLAPEKRR